MSDFSEFIDRIFYGLTEEEHICVGKEKFTTHYPPHVSPTRSTDNYYFYTASVDGTMHKKYPKMLLRQFRYTLFVYVIVCDDIGSKVDPAIMPNPSYILETSEGNFQYGYVIDRTNELDKASMLLDQLAAGGFTDPGAKGCARLMRVPGSYHTKTGFRAVLHEFNDDVWTLDDLFKEFNVEQVPLRKKDVRPKGSSVNKIDRIITAKAEELFEIDPVMRFLFDKGYLYGSSNDRYFHLQCPVGDHEAGSESSTSYSPLGYGEEPSTRAFHCQHGTCEDHNTQYFLKWVASQGGPDVPISETAPDDQQLAIAKVRALTGRPDPMGMPDAQFTSRGDLKASQHATLGNVKYITAHAGVEVRYNLLNGAVELTHKADDTVSHDRLEHQVIDLCRMCNITKEPAVLAALQNIAKDFAYHPMEEWILSADWDGEDRLSALYDTVELSEHTQQHLRDVYIRKWMIQIVEAVRGRRETQKPHVLVMCGKSETGKSMWIRKLLPDEFVLGEQPLHLGSYALKDSQMNLLSYPVVELSELDQTFKASDWAAIKSFLTGSKDRYRKPYDRHPSEFPRMTGFYGSVNPRNFIKEIEGARRFWPLHIERCHLDHNLDIQQVWAQVNLLWEEGVDFYLNAVEDARRNEELSTFLMESQVIEAINETWDLKSGKRVFFASGKVQWTPIVKELKAHVLTANGVIKYLQSMGYRFDARNVVLVHEVNAFLESSYGPKRKISDKRNTWALLPQDTDLSSFSNVIDFPDK